MIYNNKYNYSSSIVENSTDVWFTHCTGSWYGRAVCKKRLPAQPPPLVPSFVPVTPFVLNALLALLGVLAFLCLSLVLLSLCLVRRRLSRALVCPPPNPNSTNVIQTLEHVRKELKTHETSHYSASYTSRSNFISPRETELGSMCYSRLLGNGQAINSTVELLKVATQEATVIGQNSLRTSKATTYCKESS